MGLACLMQVNDTRCGSCFDHSVNTTGCCPRFNPEGWDGVDLHFRDKLFARAETRSLMHVPLNMGRVFGRMQRHIEEASAADPDQQIVLSRDPSAFAGEHLFAVTRDVPGEDMTTLSGDFITKVFEGPYSRMGAWHEAMLALVRARGREPKSVWFYYKTCPECAKAYGKNHVVGLAEV